MNDRVYAEDETGTGDIFSNMDEQTQKFILEFIDKTRAMLVAGKLRGLILLPITIDYAETFGSLSAGTGEIITYAVEQLKFQTLLKDLQQVELMKMRRQMEEERAKQQDLQMVQGSFLKGEA